MKMSKTLNEEGIRPGTIYRIALENFVTYKQLVLYPNTSLNLIIGPYGTGKSTFVCAIILGLCGKTSVIGRDKKNIVRSGCEKATIEIELYQKQGKSNVIITRSFNLKNRSTWYIDHKRVTQKQVQELIASLNIQVDNLCQLLPQDLVQDFSKMNPQQLLRSTLLAAVGGTESVQQLDDLIQTRAEQRGLSTRLQNNEQLLQKLMRLNERLKVVIDLMQHRKEIEVCKKKILWLEYQELRDKVIEYTRHKENAVILVEVHKRSMKILEGLIDLAKDDIWRLEQQQWRTNREVQTLKDKAKELLNSEGLQEDAIKNIEASFQDKLERHRNRERELAKAKAKLDKLVTEQKRLVEKVGDELNIDLSLIPKPLMEITADIDAIKQQKLDIEYDLMNNITRRIRFNQDKIRNIEDVYVKRLEVLRKYSEDSYNAVSWLRENRDQFQHQVYEPMMLEINFKEPIFARYLESTVSARDLFTFTFESRLDMNVFLKKVRIEGGLKRVNAVCSQNGPVPKSQHIRCLDVLGFYTFVVDTITAPAPILRYLCDKYKIHKIPIGSQITKKQSLWVSQYIPNHITYYFTENYKIEVKKSRYSQATSRSIVEIEPARLMRNILTYVDIQLLEFFKSQLSKYEENASSHLTKMQELDQKLGILEINLNEYKTRLKEVQEEKVRTITAEIRMLTKQVQEIESEPFFDINQERERCRKEQKEYVTKQCKIHQELCEVMNNLDSKVINGEMWKTELDIRRNSIVQQESELQEIRNDLRSDQTKLENIETLRNQAKSAAKEKLVEVKRSCNNKLPSEPDFPYKEDFDVLPSDIKTLQEHLQTRIECMDKGEEQVTWLLEHQFQDLIKEYEDREKQIEKLKREVNNSSDARAHKQLEDKMKLLSSEWLPPLLQLLQNINKSFGDMFAKLGYAGEIKLDKGESDKDYDQFGISILVQFRAQAQMQQLSRHVHSDEERALSTALYMFALQRLTTVPFRCVDEPWLIQGMDPVNERKMFQLIVKVTTECDNAQYFLSSSKLLNKLEDNEKVMVHTIMNGTKIMKARDP